MTFKVRKRQIFILSLNDDQGKKEANPCVNIQSILSNPRTFYSQKNCHEAPPTTTAPKTDNSARRELALNGALEPGIDGALHTNGSVPQVFQAKEKSFWVNLMIIYCLIVLIF